MKTRLEIYNNLCGYIEKTYKDPDLETKVYETEDTISSYVTSSRWDQAQKTIDDLKEHLKVNGYKTKMHMTASWGSEIVVETMTTSWRVIYNKESEKISVAQIARGWKWSNRKEQYYPYKICRPIFTLTNKNLYYFESIRNKLQVRVFSNIFGYDTQMAQILCGLDYSIVDLAHFTYKDLFGTKSLLEAVEKKYKTKIPTVLKNLMTDQDLVMLSRTIEQDQMNKLCQYVSLHNSGKVNIDLMPKSPGNLIRLIKHHFGYNPKEWSIVQDCLDDCAVLKKKFNMKITSKKRLQEEHFKDTKLRMLRTVKSIKTDKKYKNLLDGLPYPHELINSKDRLIQESITMHHCVASYARKINQGHCGIYAIKYAGENWTLEIVPVDLGLGLSGFQIQQIRGLSNKSAPEELVQAIKDLPTIYKPVNHKSEEEQLVYL